MKKVRQIVAPAIHPSRLLRRETEARKLSANRLAFDLGEPSERVANIRNSRRSFTADTTLRLALYFGKPAQFRLDLPSQHDMAIVERKHGAEIKKRPHPADAA